MLKKITLLIICFIIPLTILGIILYQNTIITRANTSNFIKIENLKLELSELSYLRKIEIKSENISLGNMKVIDIDRDTLNIERLINDDVLILRIIANYCAPCVQENLSVIDSLLNNKSVIILGTFYNYASYKYFTIQYNLDNCYMLIDNQSFKNVPAEKDELMYYMRLTKNMKTDFVHVPLKGFIHHTLDYLLVIKEKLSFNSTTTVTRK